MSIEFIPLQRKPLLLTIVATALLALAYGQVVASAEYDQGLLIGIIAAVGAAAAKAFGNEREDAGEDAQGGNPMTRFNLC